MDMVYPEIDLILDTDGWYILSISQEGEKPTMLKVHPSTLRLFVQKAQTVLGHKQEVVPIQLAQT